uniref:Uncharacterized protein n=1 Tax=Avena sativa TaxID=4498 RepID=A0ACD5X7F7_AVESA
MEIAVGALSGMVDALPGKLGELLLQEYALLSGVRGDVTFFQAELSTMHAAVLRCEALDDPDVQTKNWIGQVRELAYDIEDWVDLFAHRVDAGSHGHDAEAAATSSRFFRWIRRGIDRLTTIPDRHVIATELQELRQRVVEVSEQRKRYSLGLHPQVNAAGSAVDPRIISLYADSASLVGLDGPRDEVAGMVTGAGAGSDGLKVVSIAGMAGSGKTTLAREVYGLISSGFKCRASVSAGRTTDIAKVLSDMLYQVDSEYSYTRRGDTADLTQLIGRLRQHFNDKRYLVMIDDLWSIQTWETIKYCFPENNLGSRIIITTRIEAVAKAGGHVYRTHLLDEADAETLFSRVTFGSVGGCPPHLKDVSAQILRKCGGLPLAIVSVGAMLANKPHTRDEFARSGLEWQWEANPQLEGMKQIIKLGYTDLPAHLKACLLYLSIFPENHEIEIERLVRRWIAEGFIIEHRGSTSTEETARKYINDLIGRNLIRPTQLNHDATPRSCVLHPVIHKFIVSKSMEDNFVALVHAQQQDVPPGNGTVRRLSLLNSGNKPDQDLAKIDGAKVSRARSITVFAHTGGAPTLNELSVLRVLDLQGCEGPLCLDGLCKLLLLRYLNLKGTDVSQLPAQIGELKCLETLDVRSTKVKELPPSILILGNLKHLLAGNAKLPVGISKMKSLLTLSCSNVGKSATANIVRELSGMASLRELELFCDVTQMMLEDKKQVAFPSDGFRSLKKLSIRSSSRPSVAFVAGALPKVEVLDLKFEKGLSEESSSGVSGIEHLSNLKHMLIEFSQDDAGAAAAVRKVTEMANPNCQVITTVNVDRKSDK